MRAKLLALFFLLASPAFGQTVAIRAGHLVDPAKGTEARNQIILVENGKIKSISSGIAIPRDAQVVDLSREWVTPGMTHAHAHLTLTEVLGAPFESNYLKQSSTFRGPRTSSPCRRIRWKTSNLCARSIL